MSPHLVPALLAAAAEQRRDPDLMSAAAHRITTDTAVIDRLVAALARATGASEQHVRLSHGLPVPVTQEER